MAEESRRSTTKSNFFIYFISILSAVGGFLFGYDTGVISGAMVQLKSHFRLVPEWQELVVSVAILSAWLFCLIGGVLSDSYGRKRVIIFASFMFTVGSIVMGLSEDKIQLLIGRIIIGSGIGLASMIVPVYIAEVSPADLRGKLVTINNCCITMGQFIASLVDGAFSTNAEGWRFMLGLAAIPSVIQFVGFLFMPESPRWLTSKRRYGEAVKILKDIRNSDSDVVGEFNSIKTCIDEEQEMVKAKGNTPIILQILRMPNLRRALAVGCGLQIIQQVAGINTVMYYSATIIEMSGIAGDSKVIWLSSSTAAMNAVCSLAALFLIERVGRRILTLSSLAGVILSLSFLAISFQVANNHTPAVVQHVGNSTCNNYGHCSTCIESNNCGFCYEDTSNGPQNGSCVLCEGDDCEFGPANSSCSKLHIEKHDMSWADTVCPSPYAWLTLLGLLLYLLCFAPGMGPMPWTINSEIYPLWARSTCFSLATSCNWFFNFLVSLSFLTLTKWLTKPGAFWLYTGLSTSGFIFLFLMLPETRGKSLEDMENLFERPPWKQMNCCCSGKKSSEYEDIDGQNRPNSIQR